MEKSTCSHLVAVAIDFGTTYSGYAFSFKSSPQDVKTNQSWSSNLVSLKTPTVMLLNPERKFHSFGFEAETHYSELLEDEEAEGWSLFRRFKMELHENPTLSLKSELTDLSKKVKMAMIDVFSLAIRYMKDHALTSLNSAKRQGVCISHKDVYFVLTVPAIWDDRARLFMRQAAVLAGIPRSQIGMALESEAASIWCQTIPVGIKCKDDRCNFTTVGSKYMVVDIGGGTADIAVHHKLDNGKLHELYKASGGHWGGTQVDKRFIGMLADLLGEDTMRRFSNECLCDVIDLLKAFETTKRTISPTMSGSIKVRLPLTLYESKVKEQHVDMTKSQLRRAFINTLRSSNHGDKLSIKADKLRVDAQFARDMFSYSITELIRCVKEIFANPDVASVDTILVVGGFSECSLVQHAFRENFKDKKIIFPSEPGLIVLKGAVLYGHNPQIIDSRKARFTYGIKHTADFNPEVHDRKHKVSLNGAEKCTNLFQAFVRKGDNVRSGFTITQKYAPAKDDILGGYMTFAMYLSSDADPMYVTEHSCTLLGKLEVKLSEVDNKDYETHFIFGDTEIMLVVKHLYSGKMFSKYLNFC